MCPCTQGPMSAITELVCCNYWSWSTWSLCSATRKVTAIRSPLTATKSSPHLPQLQKAYTKQQRPSTAKNKYLLFLKKKKSAAEPTPWLHPRMAKTKEQITHRMEENTCKWSNQQRIYLQILQAAHVHQKNGKKTSTDISPRKTYWWPRSTWKDAKHH